MKIKPLPRLANGQIAHINRFLNFAQTFFNNLADFGISISLSVGLQRPVRSSGSTVV